MVKTVWFELHNIHSLDCLLPGNVFVVFCFFKIFLFFLHCLDFCLINVCLLLLLFICAHEMLCWFTGFGTALLVLL